MLAQRIRELRERGGMSQAKLAEALGVSQPAVNKWENGQSRPDLTKLRQLAELFGVTMDELCGDLPVGANDSTADNISVMSRAFRQMTPEEQEKYLAIGRMMFAHAFGEEAKR